MIKTIKSVWESKSVPIAKGESSGYDVIKLQEKFFGYTDLLVRPVYDSLYKQMVTDNNEGFNSVVLGTPGIGKRAFLIYTLLRRIAENKPTLIHLHLRQPLLVLNKDNIIELNHKGFEELEELETVSKTMAKQFEDIWILYDIKPNEKIMEIFCESYSILASSGRRHNYKEFEKLKETALYYVMSGMTQKLMQ